MKTARFRNDRVTRMQQHADESRKLTPLALGDYREMVQLDAPPKVPTDVNWQRSVVPVLCELGVEVADNLRLEEAIHLLHATLASIAPFVLSNDLANRIEAISAGINAAKGKVDVNKLPRISQKYSSRFPAGDHCGLWVGDITRLECGAIVNAANDRLLGCRVPNHPCIDNAIHSAAGPRLRDDCAKIIQRQGSLEPNGTAKLTRGYALPSQFVLHTVGPQLLAGASPTKLQRRQLVSAYRSCLEVAAEVESIRSIAFCAISTGIFAYPKTEAAKIALTTVASWLQTHTDRFDRVLFNLFTHAEASVYEELLNDWERG